MYFAKYPQNPYGFLFNKWSLVAPLNVLRKPHWKNHVCKAGFVSWALLWYFTILCKLLSIFVCICAKQPSLFFFFQKKDFG